MKKIFPYIIAIVAFVVIAGGFAAFKILQFRKMSSMKWTMPPQAVTAMTAGEEEWSPSLKAVGSLAAVQGVTVSTDQPGIVTKINFESGQMAKEGDLLVQIDVTQEEAQLRSALAQQKLAGLNLQRQQNLLKNRVSSQADFDAAQAEYDRMTASVLEMQSHINKKTIRAPFSGVLGIRMVNLGQYMQSGAQVAPLQSLDPIYVNFWLPQQSLSQIQTGRPVQVKVDGFGNEKFAGKINAVDSVVDEATRNVRVQATLPNPKSVLRPGMFANVEIPLDERTRHVILPATAVQFAPYGDMVYIAEEMKGPDGKTFLGARQQVVKTGESQGDRIVILSGVKPGEQVVTSGGFKLKQGDSLMINNTIEPGNNLAPTPEDN